MKFYVKISIGILLFSVFVCRSIFNERFKIEIQNRKLGTLKNIDKILEQTHGLDTYIHRWFHFSTNLDDAKIKIKLKEKLDELRRISNEKRKENEKIHGENRSCEKTCCWSKRNIRVANENQEKRQIEFSERISSIHFKLHADLHFGELPVPDGIRLKKLTIDIIPCLQKNSLIFVDSPWLRRFFDVFLKKISVDFILISGDSDLSNPKHLQKTHKNLLQSILDGKTRIRHWFSMNCDLTSIETLKNSKVFTCIPQGISQWFDQRFILHLANGRDDSIKNRFLKTDDYWLLVSFNKKNGAQHRRAAWKTVCETNLRNISKCFYSFDSVDLWTYYLHIGRSKFVLSPPGAGLDCYRTWETLYLGSIPIVLRSSLDSIFDELPVLIIDHFDELNQSFLEKNYQTMTLNKTFDYRRLFMSYWKREIDIRRDFLVDANDYVRYRYDYFTK